MKVKFILKNKVEIIHTVEDKYYKFFKKWSENENKDCGGNDCTCCCWISSPMCKSVKLFSSVNLESIEIIEIPVIKTKYYLCSYVTISGYWIKSRIYYSKEFKKTCGNINKYLKDLPDDKKICHENEFIEE